MNDNRLTNITLQQLESLIHLIREQSFIRGAKKMGITQPSLTKHIKNMEHIIGVKIVNRDNAGVSLTPEGQIIHEYARKVIGLREALKEKLAGIGESESGIIEASASTIPATYILPHILSHFSKQHPKIRVYLKTANSEESLDIILNDHAEIGFVGKKPLHRKIHAEPLWKDRLILAVPLQIQLRENRHITAEELMKLPFVMREKGSGTREILEEYVREKLGSAYRFNTVAELGSSEAVKEAVIAGMGVSVISIHAVRRELQYNLITEATIEDWNIERDFFLIFRKRFHLMRHHQVFLDFIRETGNTSNFPL